jgi:hypothetical protein
VAGFFAGAEVSEVASRGRLASLGSGVASELGVLTAVDAAGAALVGVVVVPFALGVGTVAATFSARSARHGAGARGLGSGEANGCDEKTGAKHRYRRLGNEK